MVEQFVGTWKLVSSENFDEYMKEVGMSFASRQVGNLAKPKLVVNMAADGFVSMKAESSLKTAEVKFRLDEECDETTADGRKAKSIFKLENGKLVQTQSWDGKTTTLEREVQDGKLVARLLQSEELQKCIMNDVVAVRTYEKAA